MFFGRSIFLYINVINRYNRFIIFLKIRKKCISLNGQYNLLCNTITGFDSSFHIALKE